jgi:hypothetical protein
VLGGVARPLLERAHPDGVGGDDLADVLAGCVAATSTWWPQVDPLPVAVVLTGAFGVAVPTPEDLPKQPGRPDVVRAALALVAYLLARPGAPEGGRSGRLAEHLDAAFTEIAREDAEDG